MRITSSINIDLSALHRNVQCIRSMLGPSCGICAVVKADAYGLGAPRIARQLAESGVSMLAVYSQAQAEIISAAGVTTPQLILMPVREIEVGGELHRLLLAGRLQLVVHGVAHAQELAAMADQLGGGAIPVHLEVDTGMSRGGVTASDAARALAWIADDRRLRLAGVFTHFSDSRADDARTREQVAEFDRILEANAAQIPTEAIIHVANSHAMLRGGHFQRMMVRTGLAWTGLVESSAADAAGGKLGSIVRWESSIVHTKSIDQGASVGYGSTWQAKRQTRLGIIPVGYFDGYPMARSSDEQRWIRVMRDPVSHTQRAPVAWEVPVVGAVNMDQIVVDLSDVPASIAYGDGYVGMTAEIYGSEPTARNFLPRIAEAVGTHSYELLCRMNAKIPRRYIGEGTGSLTGESMRIERHSSSAMTA